MQPPVQPGDYFARLQIGNGPQIGGVEAFEEQGPSVRVGAEQSHGTVARPVAQCQVLVLDSWSGKPIFSTADAPSHVRTGCTSEQYPLLEVRRRPGAIR